ncbi:MAG: LysE family translocator [Bacteroidota bacterium]
MEWIGKGLLTGLLLAVLVGPLLFALVQEGLEKGLRAGMAVGLGIWVSDFLFIIGTWLGVSVVANMLQSTTFQWLLAGLGSIVLFFIGLGTLWSQAPVYKTDVAHSSTSFSYGALWLKGFLINTINPFTIAFWASLMTTVVFAPSGHLTKVDAGIYLSTILCTIITTDTLKVLLAKKIRPYMKPRYILMVRRVVGVVLIGFGIYMLLWALAFRQM